MKLKYVFLLIFSLLLMSCNNNYSYYTHYVIGNYYEGIGYLSPLNTSVVLKMFEKEKLDEVSKDFDAIINNLNKEVDRYNLYDNVTNVKAINDSCGSNQELIISEELFELITMGIELTKTTKGNFHLAMGTIIDLYEDYFNDENGIVFEQLPTDEEINKIINAIPPYNEIEDYVILNKEKNTIKLNKYNNENIIISLGAIAKGYVMQKAYEHLIKANAPFIFDAGSSTVALSGKNPLRENNNYVVSFINPIIENESYLCTISVDKDTFISTSGDYQKYFRYYEENKEKTMHHILDVNTGKSNSYYKSISLVSYDASLSLLDALSTALFNIKEIDECLSLITKIEEIYDCEIMFSFIKNNSTDYLSAIVSESFDSIMNNSFADNIKEKTIIENY